MSFPRLGIGVRGVIMFLEITTHAQNLSKKMNNKLLSLSLSLLLLL